MEIGLLLHRDLGMRMNKHLQKLGLLFFVAFIVSSCSGEEDKKLQKAANWIEGHFSANPPNNNWVLKDVSVDGGEIVISVKIPNSRQVRHFSGVKKISQMRVARAICPRNRALDNILGKKGGKLSIELWGKNKLLTRSKCRGLAGF